MAKLWSTAAFLPFFRLRPIAVAWTLLGCLGAFACVHAVPAPQKHLGRASNKEFAGKLPEGISPRLYDVHLLLDPNADHFTGVVDLAVDLLEPDDRIVLHAEGLHLRRVSVRAGDERPHTVSFVQHAATGTLALHFEPALPNGVSTLHFEYDAPYSDGLLGIYRTVSDNRAYLFSQFEPIAARKAFPCFDEPRFKAPFQLTLTVPKDAFAASNSQVAAEQERAPGQKTLVFQPTPPLPTYLIAVAVGPFDVVEGQLAVSPQRPYALPLRALASAGSGDKLKLATERTGGLVQAIEGYVDLPYPFAKLDLVAVPDFAWGAMENAGLITFRDWLLLMDGPRPPYSQRRAFESVMAHELTHQWFGNWVTMPWWDDLWLNEAFASWRGQRTAQHTRPGMQFDVEMAQAMGDAMNEDGLQSVRRVREPCHNKDDIHNASDTITYQKGAAVLAMFEHYVGPERFMQGVRAYLKRFPFATADSTTFLATLSQASGEPGLAEAMQTFLDQPGVPEVRFAWRCEDGRATLDLSQDRWRPLGSDGGSGLWKVPVCFRYGTAGGGKQKVCTLLHEASHSLQLRGGCPTWFVANADGVGYYRSRVENERAVEQSLLQRRSSVVETYVLLDNTTAELRSGAIDGGVALTRILHLLDHDNPRVVRRALGAFEHLMRRYVPAADLVRAQARLAAWLRPQAKRLAAEQARLTQAQARHPLHGSEADAAGDALGEVALALKEVHRQLALTAGDANTRGLLAHQGVLLLATLEAKHPGAAAPPAAASSAGTWAGALAGVDGDSLDLALTVACDTLGTPFVDRLVRLLGQEPGGEVRRRVVQALGLVTKPAEAAKVRSLVLDPALHTNEVLSLLQPQLAPGPLQQEAWGWLLQNLPALVAKTAEKDRARLIASGGWQCTPKAAEDLQSTFAPLLGGIVGGTRALAQAQESILQCVAEVQAQQASVRAAWVGP